MLPNSLYSYVWQISRSRQIRICLLIAIIAPLSMAPLELQRRIVDYAVSSQGVWVLATLGSIYLGVTLVQGGLKYVLNIMKGHVLEEVTRDLRKRIVQRVHQTMPSSAAPDLAAVDEGTTVSILAAESEDIGGFASESLAVPALQIGTMLWVAGYLIWVEPAIAVLAIMVYAPQVILVPRIQRSINRLSRAKTSLVRKLGRDVVATADTADSGRAERLSRIDLLINQIFGTRILIYRRKYFLTFLGNFLDSLGPLIVLVAGGYLVIRGQTDVSTLFVFISGFQRLSDPWDQLVNFFRTISNTRVTYGLVSEALGGARISADVGGPVLL